VSPLAVDASPTPVPTPSPTPGPTAPPTSTPVPPPRPTTTTPVLTTPSATASPDCGGVEEKTIAVEDVLELVPGYCFETGSRLLVEGGPETTVSVVPESMVDGPTYEAAVHRLTFHTAGTVEVTITRETENETENTVTFNVTVNSRANGRPPRPAGRRRSRRRRPAAA
jgi:hypothetical protein